MKIDGVNSNFEREKLRFPFGFKGGYLTELWQTVVRLRSGNHSSVGLATQSVLYGDPVLFSKYSEAGGNALMYSLTEQVLSEIKGSEIDDHISFFNNELIPVSRKIAERITGLNNVNPNFVLNALVSIDNALWGLRSGVTGSTVLEDLIPEPFRESLSHRNEKVGIMFQVSYNMDISDIQKAAYQGYFIIKIKTGQPGTQEEMLQKDKDRLSEIHRVLKNYRTPQTKDGRLIYTIDANGRYYKKETLERFIDFASEIGALDHILFIEEPLSEENDEYVGDLPVPIAADDSVHTVDDVKVRLEKGYGVIVLKGIAKSLSLSIQMATVAHKQKIPCVCSDLTVNPILVDWHKNLASRLAPFPGLEMGIMETNGDMNYVTWNEMKKYHNGGKDAWTDAQDGVFSLNGEFYQTSGGIFTSSSHYESVV
ncbi:mandelate racemase/muconate lactonizing enzyme family protein [Membranihabitans maritimus]|uniref:mandelate racemase/muconate lactonizing enzyme family protein n=1 Tax=Membranihabitans maritimus TaxID=2904244 RepID=UPI001F46B56A|nr:mandelate racemase/muconate lactonizing enzyme family protein [Membranihabitans maritimus]